MIHTLGRQPFMPKNIRKRLQPAFRIIGFARQTDEKEKMPHKQKHGSRSNNVNQLPYGRGELLYNRKLAWTPTAPASGHVS